MGLLRSPHPPYSSEVPGKWSTGRGRRETPTLSSRGNQGPQPAPKLCLSGTGTRHETQERESGHAKGLQNKQEKWLEIQAGAQAGPMIKKKEEGLRGQHLEPRIWWS